MGEELLLAARCDAPSIKNSQPDVCLLSEDGHAECIQVQGFVSRHHVLWHTDCLEAAKLMTFEARCLHALAVHPSLRLRGNALENAVAYLAWSAVALMYTLPRLNEVSDPFCLSGLRSSYSPTPYSSQIGSFCFVARSLPYSIPGINV